jgi:hypothetical protein
MLAKLIQHYILGSINSLILFGKGRIASAEVPIDKKDDKTD